MFGLLFLCEDEDIGRFKQREPFTIPALLTEFSLDYLKTPVYHIYVCAKKYVL